MGREKHGSLSKPSSTSRSGTSKLCFVLPHHGQAQVSPPRPDFHVPESCYDPPVIGPSILCPNVHFAASVHSVRRPQFFLPQEQPQLCLTRSFNLSFHAPTVPFSVISSHYHFSSMEGRSGAHSCKKTQGYKSRKKSP